MTAATDLPVVPEFAVPDPDGPHGGAADVPDHVHCADGWLVDVLNDIDPIPAAAVLGVTVFSARPCLVEAMAEVHERYLALADAGFFTLEPGQVVQANVSPIPMGEVTDPDGVPLPVQD